MANRRFAPRAVCRPTFWEGGNIIQEIVTGATTVSSVVAEANLENVPQSTLVRIRGAALISVNAIGASGAKGLAVMGIKLATAAAVAGGTVESPNADIGFDWIWWQVVGLSVENTLVTPGIDGTTATTRVMIDSKAMRKVGLNSVFVFVTTNVVMESTMTIEVQGAVRVLFKR